MDGLGRLTEPLKRSRQSRRQQDAETARRLRGRRAAPSFLHGALGARLPRVLRRWLSPLLAGEPRRGAGVAAAVGLVLLSVGYGVAKGGHGPVLLEQLKDARDAAANAMGFRIAALALAGQKQVSREEILATAGVTGRRSLLFFDVDEARGRLTANPWIADATVLKLYPDRLQISVVEREAFALWQKDGRVAVIAQDGTVLEPYVARRFTSLPLVVGRGAQLKGKEFLALLDRYPEIRDGVRAAILVAERRWNLRLKNGMDVRLPETGIEQALEQLATLDREKKLLGRDIVAVDLRLSDRVTVRLSDDAAKAREDAAKDKKKRKGTDA
jgi:cell division protein FtsQ